MRQLRWERDYAAGLVITDLAIVIVSVLGSQVLRFGRSAEELQIYGSSRIPGFAIEYTSFSVILVGAWMLSLSFFATRDNKIIGSGSVEYKRIADASIRLFGLFAIVAFLGKIDLGRGYLLMALPIGLVLLLLGRWLWRQWLMRKRREGKYAYRTLLLGQRLKTEHIADSIQRDTSSGLRIVGALTKRGSIEDALIDGIAVLGDFADVLRAVESSNADTLILTGADDIGPRDMRRLGWDLEALGVRLLVAPALTDVAGPRIHARPVAGLPLIQVDYPTFEGRKHIAKRAFDIAMSLLLILLTLPITAVVAAAVKYTSSGPILYSQERIGLGGMPFRMWKFRSMVQGADDQLESLLDAQGTSDEPLFKVMNDPRITAVGRVIRKYSLDEFPQLFNVLQGSMSLVGPRPQREAEVALYDDAAHRRLLMKPGMSGLWQVSGRSDLSWSDSIRLDLYYVENWSITGDLVILWRTIKAVAQPHGAR